MICSRNLHRLATNTEQRTGICLTCTCNSMSESEFKSYLIKNVNGAKCPDSFCSVSMGCGWIGSHHGGARMTCGKCSHGSHFHPGLSDSGYELFNYIRNQQANISVNERQALLANESKKRENTAKERQEQEERTRQYKADYYIRQSEYCKAQSDAQRTKEQQNLDDHDKHIKDLINVIDQINKSKDKIMSDIMEHNKGYILRYSQRMFTYNTSIYCVDIVYTNIPKLKSKYCCFTRSQKSILKGYIKSTYCSKTNLSKIIDTLRFTEDVKTRYRITGSYGSHYGYKLLICKNDEFCLIPLD
jgi:hypothetical protein